MEKNLPLAKVATDPLAKVVDTAQWPAPGLQYGNLIIAADPEFSILLQNSHDQCCSVTTADFFQDALLLESIQFFAYSIFDGEGYWTVLEKSRLSSQLHPQSGFVGCWRVVLGLTNRS